MHRDADLAAAADQPPKTRKSVCIVYPADPLGALPSGIDTFIDGLIRWAPEEITVRLVGITTDPDKRPVGRWTTVSLGPRTFLFYPVLVHVDSGDRRLIPISLRFLLGLRKVRPFIDSDLLEFHRVDLALPFLDDARPKTCFVHLNMADLRNKKADVKWKHAPGLYFALEGLVIKRLNKLFCVREDAVEAYRSRYSSIQDRFHFTPTWVDPTLFSPASAETRLELRRTMAREAGFDPEGPLLITVGRLDHQKDPLLLLRAFADVLGKRPNARLLIIGDGVLRRDAERLLEQEGIGHAVALLGVMPKARIADWLRVCDVFVLSSAYEGMPMAVLEALGSGLPVVTTKVGEVSRVVKPGINGEIVDEHEAAPLAAAIDRCLLNLDRYAGKACTDAVSNFSPGRIVTEIYSIYRELLRPADAERPCSTPYPG